MGIYALMAGFVLLLTGTGWMLFEQLRTGFLWGLVFVSVPLVGYLLWLPWYWHQGRLALLTQVLGANLMLWGLAAFQMEAFHPWP